MTLLRVGLACVVCVSCFQPQGKEAEATSAAEGTGTQGTTTATPTSEATTGLVTSEDPGTSGTQGTAAAATTEALMTSGSTTEADDTTTTTTTTTEMTEGSSSGSTTVAPHACGDGSLDPGEQCDDGNQVDLDGCSNLCVLAVCGDKIVQAGEQCDDGNALMGDGCNDCQRDGAYVFVSSTIMASNFGGLAEADAKCQALAIAAGLPGMYKAWLSTDGVGAYTRITPPPWPYIRPDGKLVAVSLAAIVVDGPQKLLAAIEVTEKGSLLKGQPCLANTMAWTGTEETGKPSQGANCNGWLMTGMVKGLAGNINATDATWTSGCPGDCASEAHLYCFETAI